jgi:hypothetical protein
MGYAVLRHGAARFVNILRQDKIGQGPCRAEQDEASRGIFRVIRERSRAVDLTVDQQCGASQTPALLANERTLNTRILHCVEQVLVRRRVQGKHALGPL